MSREWHPNFSKYVDYISNHENYKGLYIDQTASNPKWVETGKSDFGQLRKAWWNEQCKKNGIKIKSGCYALIALKIHPTKKHVCQICGKSLRLDYVYPNKRTIKFFEEKFNISIKPYSKDIFEIIDEFVPQNIINVLAISNHFKLDNISDIKMLKNAITDKHIKTSSKSCLSPGAMSNSPDRFDGFHSDGACCRHKSDKGRSKENLSRYSQDRRAYENWADGDWKQADRLMSEFAKHGVSADHIGPISLGFCHRPKFVPLTGLANSAKGNRMSLSDVKILLNDERSGEIVVSWHSKYIWDLLKHKVESNQDAKKISRLMRKNLHNVLLTFSKINKAGYEDFLETLLNPEYSYFDYKFLGFDPSNGSYQAIKKKVLTGQNQKNNVERYKRIAFEALKDYESKDNRKVEAISSFTIENKIYLVYSCLARSDYEGAKKALKEVFELIANLIATEY